MDRPRIVYVTYIASTLDAVWEALTNPEITELYWSGTRLESDWQVGSKLRYFRDGKVADEHTILAIEPRHSLSHSFHPVFTEEFSREPPSRVTFTLDQSGDVVRLKVVHDEFLPDSRVFVACSDGWPMIMSSLKTLLETGKALPKFSFSPEPEELQQA